MEPLKMSNEALEALVVKALAEDVGSGDATTLSLVPESATVSGDLVSRDAGVVSGVGVASAVFRHLDPQITIKIMVPNGGQIKPGDTVLQVKGRARAVLTGERTALNFMQRMSGIATETARYVELVRPHPVEILDTRKTTPLLRVLEKYAVQCGGGANHRMGLYDRVLIKDNHLAFWRQATGGSLADALQAARARYPDLELQIELDDPEQLKDLLAEPPDWVLLDNMTPEQVAACVRRCKKTCKVEVSGGVTLDTVAAYAAAGPDAISVGALTHSARALDLSLDLHA